MNSQFDELTGKYRQKLVKKNKGNKFLYFFLQILTLLTAIASLVTYLINRHGGETTANQIFMCVMALLCLNIPVFLEKKFKIYVPNYITITLYVFIFAHFVLGEVYRAYDNLAFFDKILHTTSGVIMSFIGFSFVFMLNKVNPDKVKLSPFFIVLFTFCFTMTTEYVWEIFEYGADRIFGANMQRWKDGVVEVLENGNVISSVPYGSGLKDTMGDMMVNVVGCLGVCTYALIGMKLKPGWFDGKLVMTATQIDEQARLMAIEEMKKNAPAPAAAEEAAADYALDETAEYADSAHGDPQSKLAAEVMTETVEKTETDTRQNR